MIGGDDLLPGQIVGEVKGKQARPAARSLWNPPEPCPN